jgi:hypothetical protein
MQNHLFLAGVAGVLVGPVSAAAGAIPELALIAVLGWFILRSIARGVDAKFGHFWDWICGEPKATTALARYVDRLVDVFRPPLRAQSTSRRMRVRPLDPFDEA